MPIIWRYLLGQYLKVFLLTLFAFVGVLLVSRLDEIAHFAALGGTARFVALFTAHQIPYILPIAIPVSALISATLLFQNLSTQNELTAMRASGISILRVVSPILTAAAFLSVLNFYVISEGATYSHMATRRLEAEVRSTNPLLFLQNRRILGTQGVYTDVMGRFKNGEHAEDVLIAFLNTSQDRLNLMMIEDLIAEGSDLVGHNLSILSASPSKKPHHFDHIMIENIGKGTSSIGQLSQFMGSSGWSLKPDQLQTALLVIKTKSEVRKLRGMSDATPEERAQQMVQVNMCISEFARRLSLSFAVFAFSFLGCSFGIEIGRQRSMRGVVTIIALISVYLATYFFAKGFKTSLLVSVPAYLVPLFIVTALAWRRMSRVNRGIE